MRTLFIFVLSCVFAALPAYAEACVLHWRVDHYIHDASLNKDWAVLVNCDDPAIPAKLVPATHREAQAFEREMGTPRAKNVAKATIAADAARAICLKAGAPIEVTNAASSTVSMQLAGTAMQSAYPGQTIRVRLNADGQYVSAVVRGPHVAQLVAAAKPVWRRP